MSALQDKLLIDVDRRTVQANGWVEDGFVWTVMFHGVQPDGIKGCPCGRSQISWVEAMYDFVRRVNDENGLSLSWEDLEVEGGQAL